MPRVRGFNGLVRLQDDTTLSVAPAGDTMAEINAFLRSRLIVPPAVVTVNVADGTYEDSDNSLGNDAWCDMSGIQVMPGAKLEYIGNTGTPANVAIRGDTSGDTTPVRQKGFLADIVGGGFLTVKGFAVQYFTQYGLAQFQGGYAARFDFTDSELKNNNSFGLFTLGASVDFVAERLVISNNANGASLAGMNNVSFGEFTCDNNTNRGIAFSRCMNVLLSAFLANISVSGNGARGISAIDCGALDMTCVATGATTFKVEDNGGTGVELDRVLSGRMIETAFGGTPEIIINRNASIGVDLRGVGVLLLDVSSASNVSHATQTTGINVQHGATVQKTANTIKGSPSPANDEVTSGNGHIS